MNTVEYIASGILEQYVSGTATSQEQREVECMSHIYPEIKLELIAMQDAIEALAMAEAVAPPAQLKTNIFAQLSLLKQEAEETSTGNNTAFMPETKVVDINSIKASNSLRKNENELGSTNAKPLGFMQIAASLLFLLSTGLAYLLYQNAKEVQTFKAELASVWQNNKSQERLIKSKEMQLAVVSNKDFSTINMAGIPTKSPTSNANIFWNKKTQEVFVAVKSLPKPSADKQYQLWAIADGKPVDLGMIEGDDINIVFQKMKAIKNPQAFAVTLEVKGGVASPTMSEMYVMGAI
jgi:anti-sigma-K factor RskA